MAKVSVLIPSRSERFLTPTIRDVFRNARGELEIVAVLEGYWPEDWKQLTAEFPNLHTVHHGEPRGLRAAINSAAASAINRGAKYLFKLDAHCSLGEGFDEILKADCDRDWVVVPRRLRLDPEAWAIAEPEKPPCDYHYLSFPDDPNDFGGAGLNGKPWFERGQERVDILVDDEMSSQGSAWFMHADYFQQLELMDDTAYGPFWNEFQEIGLKCWLSGGQVKVNKKTWYTHLHKGKKYGRGYRLRESALTQGRNQTMKWIWNEAWAKQTLPFKWLIEHFSPVPGWPEDWESVLYADRKPRLISGYTQEKQDGMGVKADDYAAEGGLRIHYAYYGDGSGQPDRSVDVTEWVRSLVKDNSLDLIVNNSTLTPGQNPFRGKRKKLRLAYSYPTATGDGEQVVIERDEKDWLIIGQVANQTERLDRAIATNLRSDNIEYVDLKALSEPPRTAPALNDYLIRKFSISDRRLRAPMPIELRDFHRNDLAQLFAELGFTRGAEIGVAEGHYSEILCKSISNLQELLLVDPWRRYDGNPWAHSQEHQDFSLSETKRKTADYNVRIMQDYSMNAVREIPDGLLDFCYIDGHHGFDFVMQDLIEWSKRVRSGGIISGDDYYHFKKSWAGVVEAVNAYTNAHRISPWFLIDAPRSVDFFFVRP